MENPESLWSKIKKHVKEHREAYIVGGAGILLAGITYAITKGLPASPEKGLVLSPEKGLSSAEANVHGNNPFMFFSSQVNSATTIHRGNQGPPSYMIECLEDNGTWLSQRSAAKAKGVSEFALRSHLEGKLPDVRGEHFKRVGVAVA